jgi:hypothetical protein
MAHNNVQGHRSGLLPQSPQTVTTPRHDLFGALGNPSRDSLKGQSGRGTPSFGENPWEEMQEDGMLDDPLDRGRSAVVHGAVEADYGYGLIIRQRW